MGRAVPPDIRCDIIALYHMNVPKNDIAQYCRCHRDTVTKWVNRYYTFGNTETMYENCGAKRKTTAEEDLHIGLASVLNPFRTAVDIHNLLGLPISLNTYRKRLREHGLFSCRPRIKELL